MSGYGRGYYGSAQLARPPKRSGSGWLMIAVGIGAAAWLLWPSAKAKFESEPVAPPPPAPPPIDPAQGFPSTQAYEASALASAQELRAAGWKVELPTHLQHLEPPRNNT